MKKLEVVFQELVTIGAASSWWPCTRSARAAIGQGLHSRLSNVLLSCLRDRSFPFEATEDHDLVVWHTKLLLSEEV